MDAKRVKTGQKLLDAAHKFWKACHEEGQYGAVQWLEGTDGCLVIFTRGEYRDTLISNIYKIPEQKIHVIGERMPSDDDETAQPADARPE